MSIKQNITSLQNLLEQVNALPEAGSGGEDVTEETVAYTEKLEELETAITALEAELEGKVAGGSGSDTEADPTCTITFNNSDLGNDCYILAITATVIENGVHKSCFFVGGYGFTNHIISNVVCGTPITLITYLGYHTPLYVEINGSATFDASHMINSYDEWVVGFTAPSTPNESCTIYYSYEP